MALTDKLTAIANEIRKKTNTTSPMTLDSMPIYIQNIQTGSSSSSVNGVPAGIVAEAERVASSINSKKAANSITFIAMSDMHEMGDGDWPSDPTIIPKYRRANLNAGQGARLIAEKINPDFFVNLGDLAWGAKTTTTHDLAQSIVNARCYTAGLEQLTECFFTPGNHDTGYDTGWFDGNLVTGMIGNYRYVDFDTKKVRVICLNTADNTDGTDSVRRISGEQLQWFANTLDLSGKSNAEQWGIIVLSHHPIDWNLDDNAIVPVANCLAAYLNGTTYSVTHDGVSINKNYAGKNAATFIANFHGHTHCFNYSNISGTEAMRVAIPNACHGRNNESYSGTAFGEDETYNKIDDSSGKNTSFCVVSIDLDKKRIYADCFGAGYDRVISYNSSDEEIVTYKVTNNLGNSTTSNGTTTVVKDSEYNVIITANNGYAIDTISVVMNGEDIGSDVVKNGNNIIIDKVTGDIIITVTTVRNVVYDVTNLVSTSQEQNSTAIYNGIGYKNGVYASENGDGTDISCVATGWIPYTWSPDNVIYVRGATITAADHVRFYGYTTKTSIHGSCYATGSNGLSNYFTVEEIESEEYYKLTPIKTINNVQYIRISLIGTGDNLIITVNESIEISGTGSGESGDTGDTGDGVYTNLVSTSVTTDGITVFNGTGYMNEMYATNKFPNHYSTDSNCVTTGFIRMPIDVEAIYVKGASWQATDNDHCRVLVYSILGDTSALSQDFRFNNSGVFTVETLGDNYYKFTPSRTALFRDEYWYCMSLVGTGENLIITHDQPIE